MKDHNVSLAKLSSFITWMFVIGGLLLAPGIVVLISALNAATPSGQWVLLGTVMCYLGAGAIGIAIVSAFWRQIAKVIVDGLGGNLYEYAGSDPNPQRFGYSSNNQGYFPSPNSFGSEAAGGPHGYSLSKAEQLAHKAMGSPDLNAWGGSVGFSQWLKSLETPN